MRSSRWHWHLDEVLVKINGQQHYLWPAADNEGEVLESYVMQPRDRKASLKFVGKSLEKHGRDEEMVTDRLRSYGAAFKEPGIRERQDTCRWSNNRAESSRSSPGLTGGRDSIVSRALTQA
jgi:putative transposase